jgi:hypothetical protein
MFQCYADRMMAAASAKERSAVVAEMCQTFGRSKDWVYRVLTEHGYSSGRKKRSDRGSSSQDENSIKALAAAMKAGIRENGKATVHLPLARQILSRNDIEFRVGDSRLRSLLRAQGLDAKAQRTPSPAQRMRSLYPNHVHLADPSLALVYYLPDGGQVVLSDKEVYKNKQFLPGKEHLKVWRYVLTDHYSGSVCVRYYQTAGENSVNLWDFLMYAWGPKADPAYAFHGLPELLVWDCGSANTSRAIAEGLKSLRVEAKAHLPGNPRAKGSVEKANDLVECGFESRLRFEPVSTVAELNAAAERYCAAFNANALDGLDCRLTRMGRKIGSRLALWQRITAEQLRELPDAETCRLLLTQGPVTRKVNGSLSFSFDFPRFGSRVYQLYGQPGVTVGMGVQVRPILVDRVPRVLASWPFGDETICIELDPIDQDAAGFASDAATIGCEYKRPADTTVETAGKELTRLAYDTLEPKKGAVPFASANDGRGLAAHSFISTDGMDIKPTRKTGREVEITQAETVTAYDIRISATEAVKRIRARSGWLPEGYLDGLRKKYPEGVPSAIVDGLADELLHGASDSVRFAKEA